MTTTLNIDDDILQAAEEQARSTGKELGKVVSDLARKGLADDNSSNVAPFFEIRDGIPVVKVPPGTPTIPGDLAKKILDQDTFYELKDRIPVFKVPLGAQMLPSEEIQKLISET